jgi:hypothetical protein
MSAIACLRIAVGKDLNFADTEVLAALVSKVAGAYLETTWLWPRRFGLVAPFSFVLADPRAVHLDARELQALAADLHHKLFGAKGTGDVCLLMLEGDQTEVMRFAGTHLEELQALLKGTDDGAFAGRICKITPTGVVSVAPPGSPVEGTPPMEALSVMPAPPAPPPPGMGWWGVYRLQAEAFVGSALVVNANRRGDRLTEDDDPFALERDLLGVKAVCDALTTVPTGVLFTGFGFSSLVRASVRAALKPNLEALPLEHRRRLAVTIRQVPREPSYAAVSEMLKLLNARFEMVDLHASDPDFRIDCIPVGSVKSVTLTLSGTDERTRLMSIRRFLGNSSAYKARRVWQGVTGLRSHAELAQCRLLQAPFVSGPIVSEFLRTPIGDLAVPLADLPYPSAGKPVARGRPIAAQMPAQMG